MLSLKFSYSRIILCFHTKNGETGTIGFDVNHLFLSAVFNVNFLTRQTTNNLLSIPSSKNCTSCNIHFCRDIANNAQLIICSLKNNLIVFCLNVDTREDWSLRLWRYCLHCNGQSLDYIGFFAFKFHDMHIL